MVDSWHKMLWLFKIMFAALQAQFWLDFDTWGLIWASRGALDAERCWIADCWNVSLLIPKTAIFNTFRIYFKCLGHHFHNHGAQRDSQWTHWGPDVNFYRFLVAYWEPPGTHFGYNCVIFYDLGCQNGRQFPGPSFWWSRDGNDARMQRLYVL